MSFSLFLILLSLIDILSGLILVFNFLPAQLILYFALFSAFKGFWTLLSSFCAKIDPTIFMGAIDLATGISLFLISKNIYIEFFHTIGIIAVLKGVITLILSL
jgi:hypothetical protein